MADPVVVHACAVVDLLLPTPHALAVRKRLQGADWHAPALLDAEVLAALSRLHREGRLAAIDVAERLQLLTTLPVTRHELAPLILGAWARQETVRPLDALYVELAVRLDVRLVTTDAALAAAEPRADLVGE
ncbi:MAG TPA: type II toxin-antitoxin system VapC family toxin [Dermatophilaceae bacterium]|nr:type II toxin-antitoxin system VapC family toxin [Dermatophilaceae bacterium]